MKKFVGFLFIVAIIVGILYFMGAFKPTTPLVVAKGMPDLSKTVFITGQITDNFGKVYDYKIDINNDNTGSFGWTTSGFVGKWTLISKNDEMIKLNLVSTSDSNNVMIVLYKNSETTITYDGGRFVISGKWYQ